MRFRLLCAFVHFQRGSFCNAPATLKLMALQIIMLVNSATGNSLYFGSHVIHVDASQREICAVLDCTFLKMLNIRIYYAFVVLQLEYIGSPDLLF